MKPGLLCLMVLTFVTTGRLYRVKCLVVGTYAVVTHVLRLLTRQHRASIAMSRCFARPCFEIKTQLWLNEHHKTQIRKRQFESASKFLYQSKPISFLYQSFLYQSFLYQSTPVLHNLFLLVKFGSTPQQIMLVRTQKTIWIYSFTSMRNIIANRPNLRKVVENSQTFFIFFENHL